MHESPKSHRIGPSVRKKAASRTMSWPLSGTAGETVEGERLCPESDGDDTHDALAGHSAAFGHGDRGAYTGVG